MKLQDKLVSDDSFAEGVENWGPTYHGKNPSLDGSVTGYQPGTSTRDPGHSTYREGSRAVGAV